MENTFTGSSSLSEVWNMIRKALRPILIHESNEKKTIHALFGISLRPHHHMSENQFIFNRQCSQVISLSEGYLT